MATLNATEPVLATDPETGLTAARTVLRTYKNHDDDLAEVAVLDLDANSTDVIHTTWHHKFWDATTGQWTEVDALDLGDELLSSAGHRVRVAGVVVRRGLAWMYDLTVDQIHTYYVVAGDTPVLVHNCGTGGNSPGSPGLGLKNDPYDPEVVKDRIDRTWGEWRTEAAAPDYSRLPVRSEATELRAETRHPNQPPNLSEWVPDPTDAIKRPAIPTTGWGKFKYGAARFFDIWF